MVVFFRVAISWPNLVHHIAKVEQLDPNYDVALKFKCNLTCAIVIILASVEHILSLLSAIATATACGTEDVSYEGFVKFFYPWVFNFLPYSFILGAMTQFVHFQSTFIWNFSDLFVICMSYYLTSRSTSIFGGYEAATYFVFSLIYLISRSVAVSLIASQVNTASNAPAPVLYDVPSPVYCVEVAGTIVTYELVMFQFNDTPSGENITTTVPTTLLANKTDIAF
ncbi:unnamed protein product [Danaus chrysippus]|uniref:(African queen) hypothetical protein n=1 Tax=Danaus chrysippus TaxID=151541 RepID=A0A8J2R308_9NEOP|nr:unnamed protein product [Danaus chrysippus]